MTEFTLGPGREEVAIPVSAVVSVDAGIRLTSLSSRWRTSRH